MPIKTSELYILLWKSCDELRGGMDASRYEDYVPVLLFLKSASDKYAGQKDVLVEVRKGCGFADASRFASAKDALFNIDAEAHWKVDR